jgi:carboxymethylenebutenolidase
MITANMESKYGPLPVLPKTTLRRITTNITLLEPLSRRGSGPGLVILVSESGAVDGASATRIEHGVPSPLMKWAEESYTVVEIAQEALLRETDPLKLALTELAACQTTEPKHAVGIISAENPVIQLHMTLQ